MSSSSSSSSSSSAAAAAAAGVKIRRIRTQSEADSAAPIAFLSYTQPISQISLRLSRHPLTLAASAAACLLTLTLTGRVLAALFCSALPPAVVWFGFRLLSWLRFDRCLPDYGRRQFLLHWCSEGNALFGAFRIDTGELVGTIGYSRVSESTCEMHRLGVLDTFRGRSLGRVLCQHLFEHCRGLGYTRMQLRTATVLTHAVRIYEELGFRLTLVKPVDFFIPASMAKFTFFEKEL